MASIFSTQNLQTFLRRKNFRPPSRGPPGPPARPPGRGPRGPRSPSARGALLPPSVAAAGAAVFVVSSAMFLLRAASGPKPQILRCVILSEVSPAQRDERSRRTPCSRRSLEQANYALAGADSAGSAAAAGATTSAAASWL